MALRKHSTVDCGNKKYHQCSPLKSPCLFNIKNDPCEIDNIFNDKNISIDVNIFEDRLNSYRKSSLIPGNIKPDVNADPKLYNNTWINWGDHDNAIHKN